MSYLEFMGGEHVENLQIDLKTTNFWMLQFSESLKIILIQIGDEQLPRQMRIPLQAISRNPVMKQSVLKGRFRLFVAQHVKDVKEHATDQNHGLCQSIMIHSQRN